MLYSLLIKLAMLGLTMGVVLWIGWTVPQSHSIEAARTSTSNTVQESPAPPTSLSGVFSVPSVPAPPQHPSLKSQVPVAEKLDLNRATEQDFEALPGIGPVLAERIVEYRQARGAFRDVEQLRLVKGIGKKKFDRIRLLVTVTSPTAPIRESKKAT
jgi:competence protein ComEA